MYIFLSIKNSVRPWREVLSFVRYNKAPRTYRNYLKEKLSNTLGKEGRKVEYIYIYIHKSKALSQWRSTLRTWLFLLQNTVNIIIGLFSRMFSSPWNYYDRCNRDIFSSTIFIGTAFQFNIYRNRNSLESDLIKLMV